MAQIDTSSMLSMVNAFPILLTSTPVQKNIQDLCTKLGDDGLSGISIMGMGGSGIAGQYVQALFKDVSPIPVITIRDLELPAFIDDSWATISVSYSGNTE
ncbi:MAG: hypothetical protein ACFFCP_00970, partial [Promethearchaeota archaeon]